MNYLNQSAVNEWPNYGGRIQGEIRVVFFSLLADCQINFHLFISDLIESVLPQGQKISFFLYKLRTAEV